MNDLQRSFANDSGRLSADGRIVLFVAIVVLLNPYLPHIPPIPGRFRPDSLLLPMVAGWFLLRDLDRGRVSLSPPLFFYIVFLGWLFAVTAIVAYAPPRNFSSAPIAEIIANTENYLRPLFLIIIGTKARITPRDLRATTIFVLISSIPLVLIAVLQLVPSTAGTTNEWIYSLFSNQRKGPRTEELFSNLLGGGRVISIFGQPGTFAQFSLLSMALLIPQWMGGRVLRSGVTLGGVFLMAVLGGVISGSKVFFGGVIMASVLLPISLPVVRQFARPRFLAATLVVVGILGLAIPALISEYGLKRVRSYLDVGSVFVTYSAGRFFPVQRDNEVISPKIVRSGAWDVIKMFPVTGLGVSVINRTVDSFWLGLIVIGGGVAVAIYLAFLIAVLRTLHWSSRRQPDPTLAALSKSLMYLTLIYAAAAIGFHTFIQDRSGDLYWLFVAALMNPVLNDVAFTGGDPRRLDARGGACDIPTVASR